jgi:hypothetical protein
MRLDGVLMSRYYFQASLAVLGSDRDAKDLETFCSHI